MPAAQAGAKKSANAGAKASVKARAGKKPVRKAAPAKKSTAKKAPRKKLPKPIVVNVRHTDQYDVYVGRRNPTYGLPQSPFANPFKGPGS
ncbi:MAG: hypothetical protein KF868_15945, partial [Acidobacteria bacterium]|nr:hypothetical protein [Acidobacteriota bacterium]